MILLNALLILYLGYGLYLSYLFIRKEIESDCPYKKMFKYWFYVCMAAICMVVAGPLGVFYCLIDDALLKGDRK